jgi:hypothetical protein
MMNRKTQMVLWIIATVIGTAGCIILARANVLGTPATYGVVLLSVTAAILLITYFAKPVSPGRDKGDTL